jgi:hypothetical protein
MRAAISFTCHLSEQTHLGLEHDQRTRLIYFTWFHIKLYTCKTSNHLVHDRVVFFPLANTSSVFRRKQFHISLYKTPSGLSSLTYILLRIAHR